MTEIGKKVSTVLKKIDKKRADKPSIDLLTKICQEIYTDNFDPTDMMVLLRDHFNINKTDEITNFCPMVIQQLSETSKNADNELPALENVRIRLIFSDEKTDVYIYINNTEIGISAPIGVDIPE